jgi:hypothetical protein
LRQAARERDVVDRIGTLRVGNMGFERSRARFTYEKRVEGNVVQLDLLAEIERQSGDGVLWPCELLFGSAGRSFWVGWCSIPGGSYIDALGLVRIMMKRFDVM